MDENFYNVEKCCDEIREMISTLSEEFSYETIMCAMEKVMNKGQFGIIFAIIFVILNRKTNNNEEFYSSLTFETYVLLSFAYITLTDN